MDQTTNYKLGKPLEEEIYDISVQNANMDKIDTNLKNVSDTASGASSGLENHTGNKSNPHSVTKEQIGLGNVPNVTTNNQTPSYTVPSSLSALVSGEIMQTAFGKISKAVNELISHLANKSNPHAVTKSQVGLGDVDNTSDINKPVSTAQQEEIDSVMSALTTHRQNNANPHGVTKAQVGLGNCNNTSDANKPISNAAAVEFATINAKFTKYEASGQLGSPFNIQTTGNDLDEYTTAGIYTFGANYTPEHAPTGNINGWLIVLPWTVGNTCKQIWLRHGTVGANDWNSYIRMRVGGEAWGEWTQFATEKSQNVYHLTAPNGVVALNSDLNNYKTPGIYSLSGTGAGDTISNSPTTLNFKLIVESVNSMSFIYQTVISRIGKRWTRCFDNVNGTWTNWIVSYCNNAQEMTINSNGELVITTYDGKIATFKPSTITG